MNGTLVYRLILVLLSWFWLNWNKLVVNLLWYWYYLIWCPMTPMLIPNMIGTLFLNMCIEICTGYFHQGVLCNIYQVVPMLLGRDHIKFEPRLKCQQTILRIRFSCNQWDGSTWIGKKSQVFPLMGRGMGDVSFFI